MSTSITSANQGVFPNGLQVVAPGIQDANKLVASSADAVAGLPAVLDGATTDLGKLKSQGTTSDMFYGALNSDINRFVGRSPLGDVQNARGTVEITGRMVIRKPKFLDSATGSEVEINPFVVFPVAADAGKVLNVMTNNGGASPIIDDTLTGSAGKEVAKWQVAAGTATSAGFLNVGRILAVSDAGDEVEVYLHGNPVTFSASVTL